MFELLFGLIWTSFVTPIFIMCLVIPGAERGGADMDLSLFMFFVIFEIAGLWMLFSGLKKIIRNKKTNKYGKKCYGIVVDIVESGTYVNDKPEYLAVIDLLNPETHQIEMIEEVIGFNDELYEINSYVLCKYYDGDINIVKSIPDNEVPIEITNYLTPTDSITN